MLVFFFFALFKKPCQTYSQGIWLRLEVCIRTDIMQDALLFFLLKMCTRVVRYEAHSTKKDHIY